MRSLGCAVSGFIKSATREEQGEQNCDRDGHSAEYRVTRDAEHEVNSRLRAGKLDAVHRRAHHYFEGTAGEGHDSVGAYEQLGEDCERIAPPLQEQQTNTGNAEQREIENVYGNRGGPSEGVTKIQGWNAA